MPTLLAVQNSLGLKFGNFLQGTAKGPLGIGALLIITVLVAVIFCRRNPPS
jgi:hypothetical protein